MRVKIDFTKLLYEDYHHFRLDIGLEVINWFLKTGLEGNYERWHGWYTSGINQLIYGYSACNDIAHAEYFPIEHNLHDLRDFMVSIFGRAIISPYANHGGSKEIAEWRAKNKIALGKYRFLNFPDSTINRDVSGLLCRIALYEKKELKKKYAHPTHLYRTRPRIIMVKFSTSGSGYFVQIMFSFWEFNYEPGWRETIATQREGEYIGDFLARAERKLKSITVNTEATKRLSFETKNHFQTYSERGCFNCIWGKKVKKFYCDLMKFHRRIKRCTIDDPCNHVCDEWELHDRCKVQSSTEDECTK